MQLKYLWNWFCDLVGIQRPSRDVAPFDQEQYARSEQALVEAQQAAYESVVLDFADVEVPEVKSEEVPIAVAEDRHAARVRYYKEQIVAPVSEDNFTLTGYSDSPRCDVIVSGPSVDGKQFLVTVTADDNGDYCVTGLTNGVFRVRPFRQGKTFKPAFMDVTVNGDTQALPFVDPSSPIDCRVSKPNSATFRTINGAQIGDVQTSSNSAVPGVDSRVSKPVACGTYPQNSRK
jgi:hypothetical protein